jgi:hypothetical protein
MSTNASAFTVIVNGNLSCTNIAVADLGGGRASLTCTPPDLPAGSFPLKVTQAGKGLMVAPSKQSNNTMTAGADVAGALPLEPRVLAYLHRCSCALVWSRPPEMAASTKI